MTNRRRYENRKDQNRFKPKWNTFEPIKKTLFHLFRSILNVGKSNIKNIVVNIITSVSWETKKNIEEIPTVTISMMGMLKKFTKLKKDCFATFKLSLLVMDDMRIKYVRDKSKAKGTETKIGLIEIKL